MRTSAPQVLHQQQAADVEVQAVQVVDAVLRLALLAQPRELEAEERVQLQEQLLERLEHRRLALEAVAEEAAVVVVSVIPIPRAIPALM